MNSSQFQHGSRKIYFNINPIEPNLRSAKQHASSHIAITPSHSPQSKPMKHTKLGIYTILVFATILTSLGQDTWITSAEPPLIYRGGNQDDRYYFTNTSEKVIFGVTINYEKNRSKKSKIIIDSIEPQKTQSIYAHDLFSIPNIMEATVTCKGYSKPIRLFPESK
jgi:hypothetical protein